MKALIAVFVGVVVLVLAGLVWWGSQAIDSVYGPEYERFEAIQVGMTEEQVRELLGDPLKVYDAETAPEDYYVEGWTFKRRPITNKVFIYIATEPIAYVWFDEQNRVEEVFVGGS